MDARAPSPDMPQRLAAEMDGIMQALRGEIANIAGELDDQGKRDSARIKMAAARITQLSHRFMRFLPEVGAARANQIEIQGPLTPAQAHQWGELNTKVYRTRTWMIQWPQIELLIRSQSTPKRHPLFREVDACTQSQLSAADAVMFDLHAILNTTQQDETARAHGCFADISLPQSMFMAHLHAANRVTLAQRLRHPAHFLDVGCGGGLKLLSARAYFERVSGLEYDPGYVAQAQNLIDRSKTGGCHVIHADGLTYEDYGQYDVIYFYRPMRDLDMLRALETQITGTARPGTLIVAPYEIFDHRFEQMGCARLAGRLYVVGLSQREAASLRRKAELIGPSPSLARSAAPSVWDAILSASRRNGYGTTI